MAESPRIEELKRRVQSDPASIAFAALAEEYRRAGRFQEAIDTCTAGLVRHPSYLSAHVTLGRALIDVGRLPEARKELESVLKLAPENLAAIRGLAEIHERLRDEAHHLRAGDSEAHDAGDSTSVAEVQARSGFTPPAADPEPIAPQSAPPASVPVPAAPAPFVPAPPMPAPHAAAQPLPPPPPQSAVDVRPAADAIPITPGPIRFRDSAPPAASPPTPQEVPAPLTLSAAVKPSRPAPEPAPPIVRAEPAAVEEAVVLAPPDQILAATPSPALAGLEEFLSAILRARADRAPAR